MDDNPEKESLRKLLLQKRENTSSDFLEIASGKIQKKLKKIKDFRDAQKVGAYYPIGNEVQTNELIQELLSNGKEVFLPKTIGAEMEFRKINDFASLEKGNFDIMEPKDNCEKDNKLDILLVPTVGISVDGVRLGYGHGFYDKFLTKYSIPTISLVMEKQIVKKIPRSTHDILIDWIVSEERVTKTHK